MSKHLSERADKIEQVIAKLCDASAKGKLVVVEGKKDAEALRGLGVTGPIVTVKTGGKSFLDVAYEIEELVPSEVILLLDFDRRGREGTRRLQQGLERARIKVNVALWGALRGLAGHEIQCVEKNAKIQ